MIGTLAVPLLVLVATALAIATKYGAPSIFNAGPQGFSETLYAYTSQANNNGSAFAGYTGFLQPNGTQRRRVRDHVRRRARRPGDARRPLRAAARRARRRRLAGRQARRAGRPRARCAPTRRRSSSSCSSVIAARRAADLRPRPAPRPGRPGPAPTSSSDHAPNSAPPSSPSSSSRCVLGLAYPLAMTGIARSLFPGKADGSLVEARRQGRRLAADRPGLQRATRATSRAARRSTGYSPTGDVLQQPGPEPEATLADQLKRRSSRLPASASGPTTRA